MAQVNGLSVARMLEIEAASVVDGDVVGDNLMLTTFGGTEINAGNVRGPQGDKGDAGSAVDLSETWNRTKTYEANDVVGYSGRVWKAKRQNVDKPPAFFTYDWATVTGNDNNDWVERDPNFAGAYWGDAVEIFWGGGTRTQSLTKVAGEFETGEQALKLTLGAGADTWLYSQEENVVKDGDTVQIQVRAKLLAAVAGVKVHGTLSQNNSTNAPAPFVTGHVSAVSPEGEQTLTTSWTTYTFTMNALSGKPRARSLVTFKATGAEATIVVDRIEIRRLGNTTDRDGRRILRAQTNLTGGGQRKTTVNGVSWSQRFIIMGIGRNDRFASSGWFEIDMPPDGTVIPVQGTLGPSTVTVTSGKIPMTGWHTLYYALPAGESFTSKPGNFVIKDFTFSSLEIPTNWIMICARNDDTSVPAYTWGDGVRQDYWKLLTLTSSWVPYSAGTAGFDHPTWRFTHEGKIELQGLMKGGLATLTNPFATIDPNLAPSGNTTGSGRIFNAVCNAGVARLDVVSDGRMAVMSYAAGGNNIWVSLDNIAWFPKGT